MTFNDIIKNFGNKAQRDLKEIEPYVNRTKKRTKQSFSYPMMS